MGKIILLAMLFLAWSVHYGPAQPLPTKQQHIEVLPQAEPKKEPQKPPPPAGNNVTKPKRAKHKRAKPKRSGDLSIHDSGEFGQQKEEPYPGKPTHNP